MDVAYFYFAFSALFNALVSTFLGLFILFRNSRSKVNQTFALFCLGVTVWSIPYIFWPLARTASETLLSFQLLHIGACFVSVFYFHFVTRWLEIFEKKKLLIYFGYFLALFFAFSIPTKFFIADVVPKFSMKYWAQPGILYHFYLLMFFGYFLYSSYLLFLEYRRESGIKKQQIKFVLIGMVLAFLGGSTNYFLWYGINIPPYGNILASSFVIFTAYAILRYRLMDIRIVARQIFIYFGMALVTYLLCTFFIWIYFAFLADFYAINILVFGLVVAPFFVSGFYIFNYLLTRIANKYFFYGLYNYQQTIHNLSKDLSHFNDLNKIIDLIVDTIKKTMNLNRAGVLLVSRSQTPIFYKIAKVIGFNENNGISLVQDNFLTQYLEVSQKALVLDELKFLARDAKKDKDKKSFEQLNANMKKIEASLCLPLLSNKKLIGIIVLGSKISGDPYNKEDLDLLTTLSNQAGIAIENARLFQEVKDFNKTLKSKVDEQTKDLRAQAEHLKKLLEMRSEFLNIASHQLKTPISVILGTVSMFREGSMNKLTPAKRQKFLENIFAKTKKLNTIINDILRASEIDTENFKISPDGLKMIDLNLMCQTIFDDYLREAALKKIKLNLILPKGKPIEVVGEFDFLKQAISNLVDNAIKYTQKGIVKIDLSQENDQVLIKITDTGIGIPQVDQNRIFGKFSRAINAVDMYADGSGLGLFIVKRIIEAHPGGKISFSSKLGKGSEFVINLKKS